MTWIAVVCWFACHHIHISFFQPRRPDLPGASNQNMHPAPLGHVSLYPSRLCKMDPTIQRAGDWYGSQRHNQTLHSITFQSTCTARDNHSLHAYVWYGFSPINTLLPATPKQIHESYPNTRTNAVVVLFLYVDLLFSEPLHLGWSSDFIATPLHKNSGRCNGRDMSLLLPMSPGHL